jgi:hypothetical protein
MPRGSKPGERRGGRKKGTPNKVTADTRRAFQLVYENQLDNLERWIKETGDGFKAVHFLADGTKIPYLEKNPGKAADLLTRMAEHFVPKLQRLEKTIGDASDEELLAEVRRRAAAKGEPKSEPKPT